jgi:hypothetical protein
MHVYIYIYIYVATHTPVFVVSKMAYAVNIPHEGPEEYGKRFDPFGPMSMTTTITTTTGSTLADMRCY